MLILLTGDRSITFLQVNRDGPGVLAHVLDLKLAIL